MRILMYGTIEYVIYKRLFAFVISLFCLSACATTPLPPLLSDLLTRSPSGTQEMIAFLYYDEQGARLVSSLSVSADRPLPLDPPERQVWLGGLDPPVDIPLTNEAGVQYGLVIAQGNWQSAGNYGPGGQWPYTLVTPSFQSITPDRVELAQLFNDNRYEGRLVQMRAALLLADGTSLLVDSIGAGGIPAAGARQIKLLHGESDQAALSQLQARGNVRYGYVDVIGVWRQGRLEPLLIRPLPSE